MRSSSPRTSLVIALFVGSTGACGGGAGEAPGPATPTGVSAPAPTASHPDSPNASWRRAPAFEKCIEETAPGADLVAAVATMAQDCARAMKLHQVGQTVIGTRQHLEPAVAIPLHIDANHCYRVFGAADESLLDLDIAIVDSAGLGAGEDSTDRSSAVVLQDGEVCFSAEEDVTVNVSSGNGGGKFAVAIWAD
jgi:hypothetical protein